MEQTYHATAALKSTFQIEETYEKPRPAVCAKNTARCNWANHRLLAVHPIPLWYSCKDWTVSCPLRKAAMPLAAARAAAVVVM